MANPPAEPHGSGTAGPGPGTEPGGDPDAAPGGEQGGPPGSEPGAEPGRWVAFGERTIHRDPYVWLGQVEVRAPDRNRFWYDVIRLHRVAGMVLLDERHRVLMLWRHRFITGRWGWELPGGLVEDGEEPAVAAARELLEETGYRAGPARPLISYQPAPGRADSEHWAFLGQRPEWTGSPGDPNESARIDWVPLAAVPALIAAGQISNGSALVPLLHLLALGVGAGGG